RRLATRSSSAATKCAVSRTVLVRTPYVTTRSGNLSRTAVAKRRSRLTLRPTRPQKLAGIRIDPPPSLPCAIGTTPAATSAAAPPEDPPGECVVFQGLRVGPCAEDSVVPVRPNSEAALLPRHTRPVSRILAMNLSVRFGTLSRWARQP